MDKVLKDIQYTTVKFAKVISQVLKVDVEIVDRNLYRIAGTGMYYSKTLGQYMGEEGYVYRKVIESGEPMIIKEPGLHEVCKNCYKRENCNETFEMSVPLKIENEVIGVIGLVCFTEEQRNHIIENLDIFNEFLQQIKELIELKAREELEKGEMKETLKMFTEVMDKVNEGVLIVDNKNNIIDINGRAIEILELIKKPTRIDALHRTNNMILEYEEYIVEVNGTKHSILGQTFYRKKNFPNEERIILFTDIETITEMSVSFSNSKEYVDIDYIKGDSEETKKMKEKVKKISKSNSTVLIRGESGTGKELFARAIHIESDRNDKPFVALNCAAIPDTLLESELFGYVKGAFTGADSRGKIGQIEFADGGTLFLDEIGDMPIYLQSKLLRVLEEREITRLGSNTTTKVDIRVIAATNKDLEKLIDENRFREDLFYRLNVIPFNIPPLRDRKRDIISITEFFIRKYSKLFEKEGIVLSDKTLEIMLEYPWPGNVRELENTIEYAMNMVGNREEIKSSDLPYNLIEEVTIEYEDVDTLSLEEMEKRHINKVLKLYGNDLNSKEIAAKELGIGIATLYRKINKYGLS